MTGRDLSAKTDPVLRAGDMLTAAVLEVDEGRDALIAFGRFRAYARLPLPVVSGQNIQIQVQQADEGLRMVMVPNRPGHGASAPAGSANPLIGDRQVDQGSPQTFGPENLAVPPNVPSGKADNLEIRLFEPISDRPSLKDQAHMLRPGQSIHGRITGFRKNEMMLVDFGCFKAFAKIDVPVREGQILPLTVAKTDQGITFTIARPTATDTVGQAPASPGPQGVAPEVAGRPAEPPLPIPDANSPVPSAAGRPHTKTGAAPSAVSLTPPTGPEMNSPTAPELGRLRHQVEQLLNQIGPPDQKTAAPLPSSTQAALTHLQQILRPLTTSGDTTAVMAGIKNFVENSGLYFEKRVEAVIRDVQDQGRPMSSRELAQYPPIRDLMVTDLKPNLLILNQFLESQAADQQDPDHHVLETMKHVVQRTLAHIEQQQVGATEKPVDPDVFQAFSHLLMLADHRRDARLKVYYAKKGRREDANSTPRVALLLEMDRLGTVRTDLWMVGKDLNITFFVQEENTQAAITDAQDEIKSALKTRFNTIAVNVVVNKKKIEQFDDEDLRPSRQRLLDLTI